MNPLSKDLEALKLGDAYYNFSAYRDAINIDTADKKE